MGVSGKKKFDQATNTYCEKTYYGVSNWGNWRLNGREMYSDNLTGDNGEKIRNKINMRHFKDGDVEIDIYLDADQGLMRMKRVGFEDDDKYEAEFRNINNCPDNKDGWIAHFCFEISRDCDQEIRMAIIDKSWYGDEKEIIW